MKTELENILSKLEELAEQEAAAEAAAYYHTGGIYFNFADFREYVLIKIGTLAHFQTSEGNYSSYGDYFRETPMYTDHFHAIIWHGDKKYTIEH